MKKISPFAYCTPAAKAPEGWRSPRRFATTDALHQADIHLHRARLFRDQEELADAKEAAKIW